MIGALCLSLPLSLRLHRLDNQCRPVPGFRTNMGPVRATSPLRQTELGRARLSGTRRETLNRLWVLTAGESEPARMTTAPVGRSVHRMGCFFHPAPDPLLTNIVLQSTFLGS